MRTRPVGAGATLPMTVHDKNLVDAAIRRCDTTSRLMFTADNTPLASCRPGHPSGAGSYGACIDLVTRTDVRHGTRARQAELRDRVVRDTVSVRGDKGLSPG